MSDHVDRETEGVSIGPEMPTASLDLAGRVSLTVLEQIADRHAHELWGEVVARGEAFPIADSVGAVCAYVFPYVRGECRFPRYQTLFEELRALEVRRLEREDDGAAQAAMEWSRYGERFGAIYVSATDKEFPIQMVVHYLHPFFLLGTQALAEARRRASRADLRLKRFRFVNPHEEAFEFLADGERLLVDVQSCAAQVSDRKTPAAALPSRQLHEAISRAWQRAVDNPPIVLNPEEAGQPHSEKKILYWHLVPPVPHTWWCVPTSCNMITGFWDHYVPGLGSFTGFGRLVSHWVEHAKFCHRPDGWVENCASPNAIPNNVPSITDELIDPNTGTWRAGYTGLADFINKIYGYTFTTGGPSDGKPVMAENDWAWHDIVKEVNAGRPFFWSFALHTVVGIGYRIDSNGQKYVIYLDTYGATLQQKLKELSYDKGNGFTWLKPDGGTGPDHTILIAPRGAETMHSSTPCEVRWNASGETEKTSTVSFSNDAGKTWTQLATHLSTTKGENSYRWIPGPVTAKGRIRVQAYFDSDYLAADGSFQNFAVQAQVAGARWKRIFGPAGAVVAGYDKHKGFSLIYATDLASGDLYQFMGKPGEYENWIRVGGPGKRFVLDAEGKLFGLSADGASVWQYSGTPMQWKQVGGPAKEIYGDVDGVCAVNPSTGDLYRYLGSPFSWLKIGGPGKAFASDAKGHLYGLSPDGSGVWRYDGLFGQPTEWLKIGGPASSLYARGYGVYATNPKTGDIYFFHGQPSVWTRIGGPAETFSVDVEGRLYGLSPDGHTVWRYEGSFGEPTKWSKVGGPAATICAGWREVFAVNPGTKELWMYAP